MPHRRRPVAHVPRCQVRSIFRIIAAVVDTHALVNERVRWSLLRFASSEPGWVVLRVEDPTLLRPFLVVVFVGLSIDLTRAAASAEPQVSPAISMQQESGGATPQAENHGLSAKPVEIARPFNFPITNSMLVSWIVALGTIAFAQIATRNMKRVPTGAQNFLEWLVEALYKFLAGIIGPHLAEKTFWYFATIFIFILTANWFGLIPGVGSVGWGHQTAHGFTIDEPLLRGANADVNADTRHGPGLFRQLDCLGPP